MCEKKDYSFELAKQLHEQFAVNDNKRSNSIFAFIISLSIVLSGYGFACWNYEPSRSIPFMGITLGTGIVLTLLALICIHFGYSVRRDQIIIYHIRKEYMKDNYEKVFNNIYNPYGKKPLNFLVSFYMLFLVFITISITGINVVANELMEDNTFGAVLAVNLLIVIGYYIYVYEKYRKLNDNKDESLDERLRSLKSILFSKEVLSVRKEYI